MNKRSLAALILLNAVLLAGLIVTVFAPQRAEAQFVGANQYLMIAGDVTGREQQAAVYIINLNTAQMVAVMFNTSNDSLEVIAGRRVADDIARAGQGRR